MSQAPSVISGRVRAANDLRKGEVRRSNTAPARRRPPQYTCLMCDQRAHGWLCSRHLAAATLAE